MISSRVEIPTAGPVSRDAQVHGGKTGATQRSSFDSMLHTLSQSSTPEIGAATATTKAAGTTPGKARTTERPSQGTEASAGKADYATQKFVTGRRGMSGRASAAGQSGGALQTSRNGIGNSANPSGSAMNLSNGTLPGSTPELGARVPKQSSAESRSVEAHAAKAKADGEIGASGTTPHQSPLDWMKHAGQVAMTSAGRVFNATKDQIGEEIGAVITGDRSRSELNDRAAYRTQTTLSRIGRDVSNGPDRADQTTGADTAAKSAELERSVGDGDIEQAKTDAAELEKTTNSLPAGEAKDHLREKTDQLQDNLHLGTGPAGQTTALASDNSKISKGITSNVTNVNMYINKLAASNVQGHGAAENKTNFDTLSTRIGQFPEGEVKRNMQAVLAKMSQSIASDDSTGIADAIKELRLVSTSAEPTANDPLQQTHKIVPGETLQSIMADKEVDASQLAEVMRMNGMTSTALTPGKTIVLPARTTPT